MGPLPQLLLKIENLSVTYFSAAGPVRAVREFSLDMEPGESVALVGETGSGKSTVALALLGLLGHPGRAETGEIHFEGAALSALDLRSWRQVRGKKIGMVFQDARGALNPVLTVGAQVAQALRAHQRLSRKAAREAAAALLAVAGIPEPRFYLRRYPIELSGGMCQRVAIAIAVCNQPRLLIADEPTSALDPSIQAQILELLCSMKKRYGLAVLLISHDLAMVSEFAERVAVMYHGRLIECGRTEDVFRRPAHPYTSSLMECQADLHHRWDLRPLAAIAGSPPGAGQEGRGCPFAPRCPRADADCSKQMPQPVAISDGHWAACIKLTPG
jgi:oligopeptide/dipeptide ABC transporter ATP-binding protein